MSPEGLSVLRSPGVPSAAMNTMLIAPAILPVCCVCALIRDETGRRPQHGRWITQRTYQKIHGGNLADFSLTHTYCPKCFLKVQKTVRQFHQEVGTPR